MRIVTHHKGHELAAKQHGFTMINNLRFEYDHTTGETVTVTRITDRHCEMFVGAEGYSFWHDDGTYSGPSLKKADFIGTVVADGNVNVTPNMTPTPSQLALLEALRNGTASAEDLRRMGVDVDRLSLIQQVQVQQTAPATETPTLETQAAQESANVEEFTAEGDGAADDDEVTTEDKPWTDMAWRPTGEDTPQGEWTATQLKSFLELKGATFDPRSPKPDLLSRALEVAAPQ
jgi:hypothetical protein